MTDRANAHGDTIFRGQSGYQTADRIDGMSDRMREEDETVQRDAEWLKELQERQQAMVIDHLYPPMAQCCICGKWDLKAWTTAVP